MHLKSFCLYVILLVSHQVLSQNKGLHLLGHLTFDEELSDVWGYTDSAGNEYALVGRHNGVSIVDVTDPTQPTVVYEVPGYGTKWRDLKIWKDHLYVTAESSPGLLIVDLSNLPSSSLTYQYWVHDSITFYRAHNLYIDEKGFAYIFGSDYGFGGAVILDLNPDPKNPVPVGVFDENYLHDGFARNDTLYGAAIYAGEVQVIDVSDPASPELVTSWKTPGSFTHNIWLSEDSKYLFATDEVKNGSISAFHIENVQNPGELYRWRRNDTSLIPHNTHCLDGFLITSHYTIGVNIIDASRPHNLIETGAYDTSPQYHYEGFHGCWGAYPYLPSGKLLATDIEEGLYIFDPGYRRAAYLEGTVRDQHTGALIIKPLISIIELGLEVKGTLTGNYATGADTSGVFTVVVSAEGYRSDTIDNVWMERGVVHWLHVELSNWPLGIQYPEKDSDSGVELLVVNGRQTAVGVKQDDIIEIHDLTGRLLYHGKPTNSHAVHFNNGLQYGIYFVRINRGGNIYPFKIGL